MTDWERRIIGAFTGRYPAAASGPAREGRPFRLRLDHVFPGFAGASADSRESFLEAAEALEKQGLLSIVWARHRKGEIPAALRCPDPERLYEFAGLVSPKTTAAEVRAAARLFAAGAGGQGPEAAGDSPAGAVSGEASAGGAAFGGEALFSFLAENFTALDAVGGIGVQAVQDLARLTHALSGGDGGRGRSRPIRGITTRALSTALYGDSKRLEALMALFNPILNRARRRGAAIPDFSFLDRSFPETFIAGNLIFEFKGDEPPPGNTGPAPLANATGSILGLPLETILKLRRLRAPAPARALMIENKETFFALSQSLPGYACFLYVGGHPNRAVSALVSLLAESGFGLYHAGDLDPDGILILQELTKTAGKEVRPLRMDAGTFDAYLGCGKRLEASSLRRTALIGSAVRSLPGMAELISRIEETGMGVEQEIIDYRS
jgi:hypothetical protein